IGSTVSQGLESAMGLQHSFSWAEVATAAGSGLAGAMAGGAANDGMGYDSRRGFDFGKSLVSGTAAGIASGATAAVMRGGRVQIVQVASDAFGNALGQSLVDSASSSRTSAQEQVLQTAWDGTLYGSAPSYNYLDNTRPTGIFMGATADDSAIPEVQNPDGSWTLPGAPSALLQGEPSGGDAFGNLVVDQIQAGSIGKAGATQLQGSEPAATLGQYAYGPSMDGQLTLEGTKAGFTAVGNDNKLQGIFNGGDRSPGNMNSFNLPYASGDFSWADHESPTYNSPTSDGEWLWGTTVHADRSTGKQWVENKWEFIPNASPAPLTYGGADGIQPLPMSSGDVLNDPWVANTPGGALLGLGYGLLDSVVGNTTALFRSDSYNPISGRVVSPGQLQRAKEDLVINLATLGIAAPESGAAALARASARTTLRQTGAREVINLSSLRAWELADDAYASIRTSTSDVAAISENIGWTQSRVARVKDHVFFKEHQLDYGVGKFDADPAIANAWNRLSKGDHVKSDIDLLRHEIFESRFEGIFKTDYRTAHDAAERAGRIWVWE
ncbi:hypothetical protein ACQUJO_23925, partial [Ralstonia pseudosolanacearum]